MSRSQLRYILVFTLLMLFASVRAQQFPIYSQYMMNGFLLNPAVAGHEGYTAINLTVREQWLGLKDAPSTYAITGQTRLLKNSFISRSKSVRRRKRVMSRSGRVGLGGYLFSDVNGAINRTGVAFAYGYHLTLRRSQLSMGASLKTFQYKIDRTKLNYEDDTDVLLQGNLKAFLTDADFGVYFSNRYIYAGASAANLFESFFNLEGRDNAGFKLERHYQASAGYRYDMIDFLFIEPSFLIKVSEVGVAQLDLNVKFYYKEDYWAGISYRTGSSSRIAQVSSFNRGSSFIVMAGARVDRYYFGYAFDYSFTSISAKTIGSHEVMLAAKFGDSARRYRWLNRY